ncbi:MAG TPA: N-acetylmuramoyl-L-alanine amidase, partial [Thermoanaerobaculia bacterium]
MRIIDRLLAKGEYFANRTRKRYVVWHGTAGRTAQTPYNGRPGQAISSIDGWNRDGSHVGAPWLVDRNGHIYRTFDDTGWIYHLGIRGSNAHWDRASVAIEFANELGLQREGDTMYAFGVRSPNTVYTGKYQA